MVYSQKKSQLIVEFPGLYVSIMWDREGTIYLGEDMYSRELHLSAIYGSYTNCW
jgi:hypothetical protein